MPRLPFSPVKFLAQAVPALAALLLVAAPVRAEDLTPPHGPVLLSVDGAIARHNVGAEAEFDLSMLEALPHHGFTTRTVWTAGPQRFEGVLLRDLLDALGVRAGVIVATGASGYSAGIPVADATDPGPLIAYRRNGRPMRLRDKGPLWLVYPFDAQAKWQTEVVYARSIWQLDHMTIVPARH